MLEGQYCLDACRLVIGRDCYDGVQKIVPSYLMLTLGITGGAILHGTHLLAQQDDITITHRCHTCIDLIRICLAPIMLRC